MADASLPPPESISPATVRERLVAEDAPLLVCAYDSPGAFRKYRIEGALSLTDLVGRFLERQGPVTPEFLADWWEVEESRILLVLSELHGRVLPVGDGRICDAENLERLLRLQRAAARPTFEPLPRAAIALFLATQQGLVDPGETLDDLRERFEPLFGFAAPARLWEQAIWTSRMRRYDPAWLDALLQESDLIWFDAAADCLAAFEEVIRYLRERLSISASRHSWLGPEAHVEVGEVHFDALIDLRVPVL